MLKTELIQAGYALGDDEPVQPLRRRPHWQILTVMQTQMIPESASPPGFGPLIRNFNVALEVGVIKPWLKRWELSLLPSVLIAICRCHHHSTVQ